MTLDSLRHRKQGSCRRKYLQQGLFMDVQFQTCLGLHPVLRAGASSTDAALSLLKGPSGKLSVAAQLLDFVRTKASETGLAAACRFGMSTSFMVLRIELAYVARSLAKVFLSCKA